MTAAESFNHTGMRQLLERADYYREHEPVARIAPNVVYVARYDDARHVLRNARDFSNHGGFKADGVEIPLIDSSPSDYDDPEHAPIRRLAMEAAGPVHLENQRTFAHVAAAELVAQLGTATPGRAELVDELALPMVGRIVVSLLGAPDEDARRVSQWADQIINSDFFTYLRTDRGSGYHGAFPEFSVYVDALIEERRKHPSLNDGIGRVVRAIDLGVDGFAPAQAGELAFMVVKEMVIAGMGTTRDFLSWVCYEMARNPEWFEPVYRDRQLISRACEEILRLYPPVLYEMRKCLIETELHGVRVHPGDRILVGLASANRDKRAFDDPEDFRLDRTKPNAHISFGHGMHMCVGNALARIEGQALMGGILDRFAPGDLRLTPGFELKLTPLEFLYGAERVDVVF